MSKVKGHATEEMVAQGRVKPEEKEGNDMADKIADQGIAAHGKAVVRVARRFTYRHKKYSYFVKDVHNHIVEGCVIKKAILEEREGKGRKASVKRKKEDDQVIYRRYEEEKLAERKPEEVRKIRGMVKVGEKEKRKSEREKLVEVQDFLRKLQVAEAKEGEAATTWLELFTLYKLLGHKCPIKDPEQKAKKKTGLGAKVHCFKLAVRRTAREAMQSRDEELFKAGKSKKPPLLRLGIKNFLPGIRGKVVVTKSCQKAVDKELLRAKGSKLKELVGQLEGEKSVPEAKLSLKHKVAWASRVQKSSKEEAKNFEEVALRPEVTFAEDVEARGLGSGSAKSRGAQSLGVKRLLLPEGDEIIPKRRCTKAAQKGKLDLNIRSSMLSAGLRSRFKHLCTDL